MAQGISRIGVVGAGQMGAGIAQVAAQAGYDVVLVDLKPEFVAKGVAGIDKSLAKFVEKKTLSDADAKAARARIHTGTDNKLLAGCDLVVEAVVEDAGIKRRLFAELDAIVGPHAILASNTSSIPITLLASATKRPDRFIGMHFMNPVPLMKLIEVIRGADTSDATLAAVVAAGKKMGKEVHACRDFPGFISNRVLMPMINEAVFCLNEGVATAEDIDAIMKLGMNHPMGPLALADFIGLDTCLAILNVLYDGFKDPKYRPCPLLVQKVQAGHLGKKSGRGFFVYS
ncbi:MAG: 3-hydroxybutyryl-CoA dehydrogenase [Thermoplasmata archaeon]|jgi:3-hydroxybutyryl-CoA dehydrogenase|nr:3-hydroxybutyryl-CoA dehydrogenase [Thermoplasmata archaeon]